MREVTVVLTSCGRLDLLSKTIKSFNEYNTYPISKFIVIDDSGDESIHEQADKLLPALLEQYDHFVIFNNKRQGQIKSIDDAYKLVKTPYIFHLEDDWEFYKHSFIEHSFKLMDDNPDLITVWLRELDDTMDNPIEGKHHFATYLEDNQPLAVLKYYYVKSNIGWSGFCFNPGLRRYSDYKAIAPFKNVVPKHLIDIPKSVLEAELAISKKYGELGFKAAIFDQGYVKHIGWANTTKKTII